MALSSHMRNALQGFVAAAICLALAGAAMADGRCLVLGENMKVLACTPPTEKNRLLGSSAPAQVFIAGEAISVKLALAKTDADLAIEIQEITTRDPEKKTTGMDGYTDTGGHAPLLGLEGKPVLHKLKVDFGGKPEAEVEVKDLPVPAKFGTYALILVAGKDRVFLGTLCRVVKPREDATLDNVPIFGEAGFLHDEARAAERASAYYRMGVRGMRLETSWSEDKDGKYQWDRLDKFFAVCEAAHLQLMVTLGGTPQWTYPFTPDQTPAAVGPNWDFNPYSGQADWICGPELYPRYGKWITAFCQRYWKDGKGALWGLENYNEPWEGGGISGWARDCLQYRAIQKLIAESARAVDTRIQLCAASSIMNTEDKLFSDGSGEFDKYIDVFTDHYVVPPMCYGPMVAKAHGKKSVETETWFVVSEYLLPQGVAQFMACGQLRLSPWHPRALFDSVPGVKDDYHIPAPVVAATAAFNAFVTGKSFEKIVFRDHLPWVFQFGKDDDKDALLVVFGQLMPIAGDDPKERLWTQVDSAPGGTMTIDNADGLLKFYDLAGNPAYVGEKQVKLPMTIFPTYVTCTKGPAAAAERLKGAKIEGKRPVEILPRDFTKAVAAGTPLVVELHNCLNRDIAGKLAVKAPEGLALKSAQEDVKLKAGETVKVAFELASAKPSPANAYPFAFTFASDAGSAEYAETMNATIAPKKTVTIDGNLDDWKDVPGVTVAASLQKAEVTEMMRRPWLDLKDQKPDGNFAEFKVAWDDKFVYFAARVNDPTPQSDLPRLEGRNENDWFHSAASDTREPYKKFLAKHPGKSFAEVPYVYCKSPEWNIPFRRDRLQIALDVTDGWHDLAPDTDKVPLGFHAVPDTDYEYSLYVCSDGKSEFWRHLAPGVPRLHDWPHQPRGPKTTGPVSGAKHVVKLDGKVYTYECAIPREEVPDLKLQAGTSFGLMLRAGNQKGPHVDFGADKAVTKKNGLTVHPYWERATNCGVRWTLVE